MSISAFEMFSIGIGPSSSHTVGPMRATFDFINHLSDRLSQIQRVRIDLYGSLALTGMGHGTDKAVLMGLEGELPERIDPHTVLSRLEHIKTSHSLNLLSAHRVVFDYTHDLIFHKTEFLPRHANALRCTAYDLEQKILAQQTYYSIGGGFILNDDNFDADHVVSDKALPPYPFDTATELLEQCEKNNLTIAALMIANESTWRPQQKVIEGMLNIARVMFDCIDAGCHSEDAILPGGLNVKRRAPKLFAKLDRQGKPQQQAQIFNWMNLYALAVNEENAAGGRVVTAPTNGAAGIIPAVLKYYKDFVPSADEKGIVDFLLTAAAIGILYKKNASISAAEVGCQGEVGVACSMAAGALTAVMGGTVEQVEKAAEMGMEHHLGLTCDPIGGLVQIPCIERNAMGTVQAVNCAELALMEDAEHQVSLDKVIRTMMRTGKDMQSRYKETSLGGLAVNLPEC